MKLGLHIQLFLRSFFLQSSWNYAKFQNVGLLFVMWPVLKNLYKNNKRELPAVVKRYLETFNTQPVMASFCFGALAKQEQKIASKRLANERGENILEWESIRAGLSITTASIGDRLFWGALKPLTLLLALFICLFLKINFFEPELHSSIPAAYVWAIVLAVFVTFNAIALFVKWIGLSLGFNASEKTCYGLIHFDWNKTIYYAKKIGVILTLIMLLLGSYYFLKDLYTLRDIHFWTRAALIIVFVGCSRIAQKLRVPNMYVYMIAVMVFAVVSLF